MSDEYREIPLSDMPKRGGHIKPGRWVALITAAAEARERGKALVVTLSQKEARLLAIDGNRRGYSMNVRRMEGDEYALSAQKKP